jgi:hypothetical protein
MISSSVAVILNDFTSDYEHRSNLSSLSFSRDLDVIQGRHGSLCSIVSFFWSARQPVLEWNGAYMELDYLWSHTILPSLQVVCLVLLHDI